jgi:hypothetical protein
MAAQKLFGDFPDVTGVPGMVTPNITADVQQTPMSIQDQAAAYALQQRMKADREAEWARGAAANSVRRDRFAGTGLNAQGWREVNPQEEKLKQAFAEVYTPQLRRTFHDQRMADPGREGTIARRRYGSAVTGGGGYWSSGRNYGKAVQPQGQDQQRLNRTLAQMWRTQTNPYLRAVGGGMDASAVLSAMQPGAKPYGPGYSALTGASDDLYWKRPKE